MRRALPALAALCARCRALHVAGRLQAAGLEDTNEDTVDSIIDDQITAVYGVDSVTNFTWALSVDPSASVPMNSQLPKIIHQMYSDKKMPPYFEKFHESWVNGPLKGWEHKLWHDDDLRELVKNDYPWFLETYDNYDANIKRWHAARPFILHKFGGVYADLDIEVLQDPTPLFLGEYDLFFFYQKTPWFWDNEFGVPPKGSLGYIANALMASVPKHPFWLRLANKMTDGINLASALRHEQLAKGLGETFKDVMWGTGSSILTVAVGEFHKTAPNARVAFFDRKYWAPLKQGDADCGEQCVQLYPQALLLHHLAGSWNHCNRGYCNNLAGYSSARIVYKDPNDRWVIDAVPAVNATSQAIPKILHQSYRSTELPLRFKRYRQSWKDSLPSWEHRLWLDGDNRDLVKEHYPDFLAMYDSYDVEVKRIYAARFLYMHKFGGVYSDLDIMAVQDPVPLFAGDNDLVFFFAKAPRSMDDIVSPVRWEGQGDIGNALMASVPGHPFWLFLVGRMMNTTEDMKYLKRLENEHKFGYQYKDISWGTGTSLLSEALAAYRKQHPETKVAVFSSKVWAPFKTGAPKSERCTEKDECNKKYPDAMLVSYWTGSWNHCEYGTCPDGYIKIPPVAGGTIAPAVAAWAQTKPGAHGPAQAPPAGPRGAQGWLEAYRATWPNYPGGPPAALGWPGAPAMAPGRPAAAMLSAGRAPAPHEPWLTPPPLPWASAAWPGLGTGGGGPSPPPGLRR